MAHFSAHKVESAVSGINCIEDTKLSLLATRLAQHLVTCGNADDPFTEQELAKLEASLEMGREDVHAVVQGIGQVLEEAGYHRLSPAALQSRLKSHQQLQESKTDILVAVWTKAMAAVCEALRNTSVLPQVSHIAYDLAVSAGSDAATGEKNVKAHLQLGLKGKGCNEPNLNLEFSHEELFHLHSQLTAIQAQLDAIADK